MRVRFIEFIRVRFIVLTVVDQNFRVCLSGWHFNCVHPGALHCFVSCRPELVPIHL